MIFFITCFVGQTAITAPRKAGLASARANLSSSTHGDTG